MAASATLSIGGRNGASRLLPPHKYIHVWWYICIQHCLKNVFESEKRTHRKEKRNLPTCMYLLLDLGYNINKLQFSEHFYYLETRSYIEANIYFYQIKFIIPGSCCCRILK